MPMPSGNGFVWDDHETSRYEFQRCARVPRCRSWLGQTFGGLTRVGVREQSNYYSAAANGDVPDNC